MNTRKMAKYPYKILYNTHGTLFLLIVLLWVENVAFSCILIMAI